MVINTVDLRSWYLPTKRAEGICSLSGMEYLDLGRDVGPDFAATLQRVSTIMKGLKANWIGLTETVGGLPLFKIIPMSLTKAIWLKMVQRLIEKKGLPQFYTNMGNIDSDSVTFDEVPSKARLLAPPTYPPEFGAGISGYAGTLTISAGTYPSQKNVVEQFLDTMVAELPS